MRTIGFFALGLCMVACSNGPASAVVAPSASMAPLPLPSATPAASASSSTSLAPDADEEVSSPSVVPLCDTPRLVLRPRVEIGCWPNPVCAGPFNYTIDNCTDKAFSLQLVGTRPDTGTKRGGAHEMRFEGLTIRPRTKRTLEYPPKATSVRTGPGIFFVGLKPKADETGKGPWTLLETTVEIVDVAYEKAKAACLAKGGDWGSHGGMFSTIGCEPIMKDAGKVCSDESDCTGYCIQDREEVISKTEKRVFGHCTKFRMRFGCHTVIGKTNKGVMPSDRRFSRVCVD